MANKGLASVIAAVVILGSIAAVFLIANFSEYQISECWPIIPMAIGVGLMLANFIELGLSITGAFLILLLANLEVIPPFSKSWPFILIWIAILVVIGYLRSRTSSK
jgi:hypothetical protein